MQWWSENACVFVYVVFTFTSVSSASVGQNAVGYNWTHCFSLISQPERCWIFNRPPWKHGFLLIKLYLALFLTLINCLFLAICFSVWQFVLKWEPSSPGTFLLSAIVRGSCGFSSFHFFHYSVKFLLMPVFTLAHLTYLIPSRLSSTETFHF